MVHYQTSGPDEDGNFLVFYQRPGNAPTVACVCQTQAQATAEAKRLNGVAMAQSKRDSDQQNRIGFYRSRFKHDRK